MVSSNEGMRTLELLKRNPLPLGYLAMENPTKPGEFVWADETLPNDTQCICVWMTSRDGHEETAGTDDWSSHGHPLLRGFSIPEYIPLSMLQDKDGHTYREGDVITLWLKSCREGIARLDVRCNQGGYRYKHFGDGRFEKAIAYHINRQKK